MSRPKVLSYAANLVFGRRGYDHASDLLRRLEWLSGDQLVSYHTFSLLHKVRRGREPETLAASPLWQSPAAATGTW